MINLSFLRLLRAWFLLVPVVTGAASADSPPVLTNLQTLAAAAWPASGILTPPSPKTPAIHGAKVFGVRPGSPFYFTVPATGDRPMTFSADNLPEGLALDPSTGFITGAVAKAGDYPVTLHVKNALGETQRPFLIKVGSVLALTPPMGWNSWNAIGAKITDARIRAQADAMVSTGLINHGFTYINLDDYWQNQADGKEATRAGPARDANGNVLSNSRFPDMKALADYIHGKGLKAGLYSSPGPLTCGGCTGSYQHEEQDAAQYAAWGFDYLKYDFCSYAQIYKTEEGLPGKKKPYQIMGAALAKANRDIVFAFCQYGGDKVWEWAPAAGGSLWRITGDIHYSWQSMIKNGSRANGLESFTGPGRWNDPDLLIVGHPQNPTHLTSDELYTHISLWCLEAAPLLISYDLTQLDPFTLNLLTNDEVIDVDQDPLGQAAHVVKPAATDPATTIQIWARKLDDGSMAVGIFNLGDAPLTGSISWDQLGLKGPQMVHDLWRQKDLGTFDQKFDTPSIASHGVVFVRVAPAPATASAH